MQDDIIVSDKIEGVEAGDVIDFDQVRAADAVHLPAYVFVYVCELVYA